MITKCDAASRYMVALTVSGGGRWTAGWPWLRIRLRGTDNDRLLLDDCLRLDGKEEWKEEVRIDLLDRKDGVIAFELWMGDCGSTDLLQFFTAWSVNLQWWIESGAASRWYEVKKPRQRGLDSVEGECEYRESVEELQSSAAYVCIGIVGAEEQTVQRPDSPQPVTTVPTKERKAGFQFVLPHRSIARSGKLRAVRVGQIVHEVVWLRTDVLHDLLPLTLYGRCNGGHRRRPSSNRSEEPGAGMTKALILLQLSCQYANHCVGELDRHSSKVERRSDKSMAKVSRLKRRQLLLKEQMSNLRREAEVISCSLDGMRSLLNELDPAALAQLQSDNPE